MNPPPGAQVVPAANKPPIWLQIGPAMTEHICVAGSQHAPVCRLAHCAGLHVPLGPKNTPPLKMQSQLVAWTQFPLRQHAPKSGCCGQSVGVQA